MVQRNNKKNQSSRRRGRKGSSTARIEQNNAHDPSVVRYTKGVFGFPKCMEVRLRYAAFEGLFLSSVAGTVSKNFFSVNSVFDPDRTGIGHQPLYRDTYASVYNQYAVVRSKIIVKWINNNASSYWNCGIVIEDDNVGSTVVDTIAEQSTSSSAFMGGLTGSNSCLTQTKSWDCATNLNIDPYSSQLYKTAVGFNPTEEQFFCLWGNDAGANTSNLLYQVMVEYTVLFTELTTPTQS